MKKVERNEDRELTFAMVFFVIFFLLFVALNKWVLPAMGIKTWMSQFLSQDEESGQADEKIDMTVDQELFKTKWVF